MPCTKFHIKLVKLLCTITLTLCSNKFWVCMLYECVCQSVLWAISDKSDVSVLPGGCLFSSGSPNKPSQSHVLSVQSKGGWLRIFPRFRPPLPGWETQPAPFTCSWAGSPWSVGFVWALCAIFRLANLAYFLGVVRTRISTTRMSGQRVIMGNGQSSFWHVFTLWPTSF